MALIPMNRTFGNFWRLRSLRNKNCQWFADSDKIGWLKHWKWWKRYWKGSHYSLFFEIHYGHKLTGYISRSKIQDHQYEIGNLMLKKRYQGKGIMSWAISTLTDDPYGIFYAAVLEGNEKSRNVFIRTGFKRAGIQRLAGNIFEIVFMKRGSHVEDTPTAVE